MVERVLIELEIIEGEFRILIDVDVVKYKYREWEMCIVIGLF